MDRFHCNVSLLYRCVSSSTCICGEVGGCVGYLLCKCSVACKSPYQEAPECANILQVQGLNFQLGAVLLSIGVYAYIENGRVQL